MRNLLIIFVLAVVAFSVGCTDAQIARAQSIADAASIRVGQAEQAVALATEAVASAKELATKLESEQALRIIGQAEQALHVASAAKDSAIASAKVAQDGVAAAKAAQEAGGSTVDVIIAGVTVAIPAIGGLLAAFAKLARTTTKLADTTTALRLTAVHADRMEEAETDEDVKEAKRKAVAEQIAQGVHGLIDRIRTA